ncbi:MAG: hypothetical protein GY899_14045 [Verrucomicrobiaceae bacterium]|nr:hypothetical protein [Verrucomicrobiaceae bacterium]
MKFQDIKDVLTFASFRPEPDDSTVSWGRRFPNRRSLLLNLNRDGVSWCAIGKSGAYGEQGSLGGELKDIVGDMGEQWRGLTDDGWCAVSLNHRFVISLESNLTRKNGAEEQIRINPKAALGSKAERGKRYAVKHNPESNSSALLAVDEEYIKQVESIFNGAGLKIGRICCGLYGMFSDAVDQMIDARADYLKGKHEEPLGKIIVIACCEGSVCIMSSDEERWVELRSRSGLYTVDDLEPALNIIMPMLEHSGPRARLVFASDQDGSALKDMLAASSKEMLISDISRGEGLWSLLKEE